MQESRLAPQALMQLAAWEAIATGWEWRLSDDGRVALCECGRGIALICDEQRNLYRYSDAQWLALTVLHLRNHHADLDPNG